MGRLVEAGYRVVTSNDVFPPAMKTEGRELRALVEYNVGFGANRFIGNSVSTFAALALLERRHRGQWAAYYNGGNLPIAPYLPVHKVRACRAWRAGVEVALEWDSRGDGTAGRRLEAKVALYRGIALSRGNN